MEFHADFYCSECRSFTEHHVVLSMLFDNDSRILKPLRDLKGIDWAENTRVKRVVFVRLCINPDYVAEDFCFYQPRPEHLDIKDWNALVDLAKEDYPANFGQSTLFGGEEE